MKKALLTLIWLGILAMTQQINITGTVVMVTGRFIVINASGVLEMVVVPKMHPIQANVKPGMMVTVSGNLTSVGAISAAKIEPCQCHKWMNQTRAMEINKVMNHNCAHGNCTANGTMNAACKGNATCAERNQEMKENKEKMREGTPMMGKEGEKHSIISSPHRTPQPPHKEKVPHSGNQHGGAGHK